IRYSDRAKMGTLSFSDIEVTMLSLDAAVVLGRWRLKRANDEPHGRFTLIFKRLPEGWRIVQDHTSAAKWLSFRAKSTDDAASARSNFQRITHATAQEASHGYCRTRRC